MPFCDERTQPRPESRRGKASNDIMNSRNFRVPIPDAPQEKAEWMQQKAGYRPEPRKRGTPNK
jgi:hypothetical protein